MATEIVGTITVACQFLKGSVAGLRQRVEVWQSPGVDGYGSQLLGKTNAPFAFEAVQFGSIGDVDTFGSQIETLVGEIVSITDDFAVTHTNLLIQTVGVLQKRPAATDADPADVRGSITVEGVKLA